jgi:hypothetical protein
MLFLTNWLQGEPWWISKKEEGMGKYLFRIFILFLPFLVSDIVVDDSAYSQMRVSGGLSAPPSLPAEEYPGLRYQTVSIVYWLLSPDSSEIERQSTCKPWVRLNCL